MADEVLDVAIVGAGISGLYSGWRLLRADPQGGIGGASGDPAKRVEIFEMDDRIAGRLLSVYPPGMPHVACELGGMRYISTQSLVRSLVEDVFRLQTHTLPTSEPKNFAHLRGTRLRVGELADARKVPYRLRGSEVGRTPGSLLEYALDQIVPGVTRMTDEEFDDAYESFTIDGRHLYELGFWNLMLKVLSNEAYAFISDQSGYYSITTNWNAGDAIRMMLGDFRPGITYKAFVKGFETLAHRIHDGFVSAGGVVHLRHRVVAFDSEELPDGSDGVRVEILDERSRRSFSVLARTLVLAMPQRSLRLLDQTGAVLGDPEVQHLLDSVEPIPLFKLFVAYHSPWWEVTGVSKGESTTTLPLRQCYYWGVEGREPGADPRNTNSVLLASYDDVDETYFWAGLRGPGLADVAPFETGEHPFPGDESEDGSWELYDAPAAMVEEIHRQLKILHGLQFAPRPYAAAYRDWSDDPFGGGVHFWNIGYNSLRTVPRVVKPTSHPVYIIGESYAKTQGWVESALSTSEIMLQDHLGLAPPSWITPTPPAKSRD